MLSVYEEKKKKRREVKPLCASLLLEHIGLDCVAIPENSDSKNGVTLILSQRHRACPG